LSQRTRRVDPAEGAEGTTTSADFAPRRGQEVVRAPVAAVDARGEKSLVGVREEERQAHFAAAPGPPTTDGPGRSAVESSVGAQLKALVRAGWGARTNVGNRRDAERLREIEGVVGLLPQHVWKDHGEWYVHPRARDARVQPNMGDGGETRRRKNLI
jgi:hypothetical protein